MNAHKQQITASMAEDIAFKLGAVLTNEEAEIFADGYNAAMQLVNDVTTGKPLTIALPPLPVLGSTAEWYQGFAAGAASMRDECQHALTAAGLDVEVK
ncbi:hypothetical protein [Kluyvera ascorbata]